METKRESLLNALNAVKPGIDTSKVLEERTHFVFTGGDVMTYNGEVAMLHPLETEFICSVKASDLLDILNKSSSEDVKLEHLADELRITLEGSGTELINNDYSELKEI